MAPLPPHFSASALDRVPVILVGEVLQNSHTVGRPETSEWDGRFVQLWKVRVRVEQVLQGEVEQKEVDIFYFPDMGPYESSVSGVHGSLYAGHSEVFFLQRDHGKLRTICDGWRTCMIWVRTGTHYRFTVAPGLPIEDVVTKLLLSRGDRTSDKQMIDAIHHPERRWGTMPILNALEDLAKSDMSPSVRAVALEEMKQLRKVYGLPNRAPRQNL